ncbi:MAG: dihydrolipoyl dehydrogenase [Gammaproteobacteria bacterium]
MDKYDVIVIGGGPGGYVAAIRCAQLGLKSACVERWLGQGDKPALGGTCLNVGCIPSKALLDSSHHYEHIQKHVADHGIQIKEAGIDIGKMQARKDKIVKVLTGGIASLFKKHNIDWLQGTGRLAGGNEVEITPLDDGTSKTVSATNIIVATGSVPTTIPQAQVDNTGAILDSTGALALTEVPKKLGVIGAGVIGLELGSVWRRLGAEVTLLEALPDFLAGVDKQIATEAQKLLKKQGLDIKLNARVTATEVKKGQVVVSYSHGDKDDSEATITFDKLIVAVGRKPNTDNLGAEAAGLKLDQRGYIQVDDQCRTNINHIWAVGDVIGGPMLAHKAFEEGVAVAERIAGHSAHVDYGLVPWVIYTWPEIAWVGQTEQQLKDAGESYKSGAFPFIANGRARGMGETDGMVKILSDADTDRILGVHILGANASELIAEAALAMAFDASSEDIVRTCHAHPTLSESMHEAALAVDQRTLHL